MARGRFVSKAISLDEKVDALSSDTVRLLFTWLITHLDCEGRMYGDAQTVKSIVFPRRSMKPQTIEKYLVELEHQGLILRYSAPGGHPSSAPGGTYLCMKTFEKHQPGLNKERESPSQIPAPAPELLQSYSRVTPPQVKEQDKTKEQAKVQGSSSSSSLSPVKNVSVNTDIFSRVYETYKGNIGKITEQLKETIDKAIEEYTGEWVIEAIKEAALRDQSKWIYVKGILRNWKRDGREEEPISR